MSYLVKTEWMGQKKKKATVIYITLKMYKYQICSSRAWILAIHLSPDNANMASLISLFYFSWEGYCVHYFCVSCFLFWKKKLFLWLDMFKICLFLLSFLILNQSMFWVHIKYYPMGIANNFQMFKYLFIYLNSYSPYYT